VEKEVDSAADLLRDFPHAESIRDYYMKQVRAVHHTLVNNQQEPSWVLTTEKLLKYD
jgi:hypothetical protein